MNEEILEIIINELKTNNNMNFMDIVRKVWNKGIDCKQQNVANILHMHCINHKRLRKTPYFEKVGYGVWKIYNKADNEDLNNYKRENTITEEVRNNKQNNAIVGNVTSVIVNEIYNFFEKYKTENIDFYGEAELQMKLGWHFMNVLPEYEVQAERPTSIYGINEKLNKKEIDLVLIDKDSNDKIVIELKSHFYRQGAYNKRIHFTLKDTQFLEELKETNTFKQVLSVCFAESHHYYSIPNGSNAQYGDFRKNHRIRKGKYTLINEDDVNIKNDYDINWIDLKDKSKYYVLEV